MEWMQVLQVFLVPAFGYLFYEVSCIRRDLEAFKVEVAKEAKNYATNAAIERLEGKIDDLRDLIIDEMKNKGRKK